MPLKRPVSKARGALTKCPTGIQGLDEVTGGGIPRGRPTLVCGSAGCGKTLLAAEFLVRGAIQYNEPGVFMVFEETAKDLAQNVASLGFDLPDLIKRKKILIDHVHIDRNEIEETGEYDLEGLFIRLNYAIDAIGAKRVVLDTIETLFGGLNNAGILRSELRRLFTWLKTKGVTAVITGERGEGQLTRQGLEEYVSDCVILLDHRVNGQISTRRLRIVKYRGSHHGTNEYPFLIDEDGISVLPITSTGLNHKVLTQRVSSGIEGVDAMLEGKGFYRGSSVLVSGTSGTGKSSVAASFAKSVCAGGERCLYFAFEESPDQLLRNMRSIGVDLKPFVASGLLRVHSSRPTFSGLEMHLATMHKLIEEYRPAAVIVDPISSLIAAGTPEDAEAMLIRLIDFLKTRGITGFLTNLSTSDSKTLEKTEVGISSLVDTWVLLRDIEIGGERNRGLYVLKSRGMGHSNQIREFILSGRGIRLVPVYLGPEGMLTGSARLSQEARERNAADARRADAIARRRQVEDKRRGLEAQIEALRSELESEERAIKSLDDQAGQDTQRLKREHSDMARSRKEKARV